VTADEPPERSSAAGAAVLPGGWEPVPLAGAAGPSHSEAVSADWLLAGCTVAALQVAAGCVLVVRVLVVRVPVVRGPAARAQPGGWSTPGSVFAGYFPGRYIRDADSAEFRVLKGAKPGAVAARDHAR
jgi:hypothetical protein